MNRDELVIVPVALAQVMFNSNTLFGILVEANSHASIPAAKAQVEAILMARQDGEQDVTVITQDVVLATFDRLIGALTLGVSGIAAISLAVAGILVMNVMLVAVTQRTSPSSVRPLTLDDARAVARLPRVAAIAATVWGNTEIKGNGRLRRTTVNGVGAAMLQVYSIKIKTGQFLPADDAANARPFVVLDARLKGELIGAANPLGARVLIGSDHLRVIGVLEAKGQFLGIDLDAAAYIPTVRALALFNRDGVMKIDLAYDDSVTPARIVAAIKAQLIARHGREDFTIVTQEDLLRMLSNILDMLTVAVGALGVISLLVGAINIVTIMTIAVAERTGEIGLLVALGARRRTILGLFLGEAMVLSAPGGGFGLLLGVGLAQLIHAALPALPIGLLAGVLPARRAARMDPVDALRAQ